MTYEKTAYGKTAKPSKSELKQLTSYHAQMEVQVAPILEGMYESDDAPGRASAVARGSFPDHEVSSLVRKHDGSDFGLDMPDDDSETDWESADTLNRQLRLGHLEKVANEKVKHAIDDELGMIAMARILTYTRARKPSRAERKDNKVREERLVARRYSVNERKQLFQSDEENTRRAKELLQKRGGELYDQAVEMAEKDGKTINRADS